MNEKSWLQGMYIYDALLCASPIYRTFAKPGTKPVPYPEKPYEFKEPEKQKKKTVTKAQASFECWCAKFNSNFEKKVSAENGG